MPVGYRGSRHDPNEPNQPGQRPSGDGARRWHRFGLGSADRPVGERGLGTASRKDIDALLWDKLSDALSDDQKSNKIGNLLTKWRRNGVIFNAGTRPSPEWKLKETDSE